jgi:hypothetical protein
MPSAQGCVDRGDVRLTALTPQLPPSDASRPRLTRWPSRSWSTTLLPARSSRRSKAAAPRRPSEISASAAMVTRSPSATSRARSSCTTFGQPPTLAHGLRRLPVLHLCRSVRARRCLTKGDLVANRPSLSVCRPWPCAACTRTDQGRSSRSPETLPTCSCMTPLPAVRRQGGRSRLACAAGRPTSTSTRPARTSPSSRTRASSLPSTSTAVASERRRLRAGRRLSAGQAGPRSSSAPTQVRVANHVSLVALSCPR